VEITKVIPEVSYDVLGRMVPGIAAIWVWSIAAGTTFAALVVNVYAGSTTLSQSVIVLVATLLLAAYLIGHIISPISGFFHSRILPYLFPSYFAVLADAAGYDGKGAYPSAARAFFQKEIHRLFGETTPTQSQYRQATYLWYDSVRMDSDSAAAKLGKMRAEYGMLEGLYVVLVIAIPINLTYWFVTERRLDLVLLGLAAGGFVVVAWSAARTFRTFQRAVINQYYLLNKDQAAKPKVPSDRGGKAISQDAPAPEPLTSAPHQTTGPDGDKAR
jgi:hypothetical protein